MGRSRRRSGCLIIRRLRMTRNHSELILATVLLVSSPAVAGAQTPVIAGVPNFHQVDERVYRGGQPVATAWPDLAKLGIRIIVDLRRGEEHSIATESTAVTSAGMRYVRFPMNGFDTPSRDQIDRALALLDGNDKVLAHCQQG